MDNSINTDIGKRLREIRHIFNEGGKLSARQFAYLLDETVDRILNYENGRAAVSLQVLINLYIRGINPIYLLTGEGSLFADNQPGTMLREKVEGRKAAGVEVLMDINYEDFPIDKLLDKAKMYNAAAGDIMEYVKTKAK